MSRTIEVAPGKTLEELEEAWKIARSFPYENGRKKRFEIELVGSVTVEEESRSTKYRFFKRINANHEEQNPEDIYMYESETKRKSLT